MPLAGGTSQVLWWLPQGRPVVALPSQPFTAAVTPGISRVVVTFQEFLEDALGVFHRAKPNPELCCPGLVCHSVGWVTRDPPWGQGLVSWDSWVWSLFLPNPGGKLRAGLGRAEVQDEGCTLTPLLPGERPAAGWRGICR